MNQSVLLVVALAATAACALAAAAGTDVLGDLAQLLSTLQIEILIFVVAVATHTALFGRSTAANAAAARTRAKAKAVAAACAEASDGVAPPPGLGSTSAGDSRDAQGVQLSLEALRFALKANDLDTALTHFQELAALFRYDTPSPAPQQLLAQLARLANRRGQILELLTDLRSMEISPGALGALVSELAPQADEALLGQLEALARAGPGLRCEVLRPLLRAPALGAAAARRLLEAPAAVHFEVLAAAATRALRLDESALAEDVMALVPRASGPAPAASVAPLVRLAARQGGDAAVCDLLDGPLLDADMGLAQGAERPWGKGAELAVERLALEAALRNPREPLAARLVERAASGGRCVSLVKALGSDGQLEDAVAVFRLCPEKSSILYNAILDACVCCGDLPSAERVAAKATRQGVADVVTYNTLVKAHIQKGDLGRARRVMTEMRQAGFSPNHVTFHELLDATQAQSTQDAWGLVEDMQAGGLLPNRITCSIMLKNIRARSDGRDTDRIMAMVGAMEEDMDEVLLSSVVEACVRSGRGDLLLPVLKDESLQKRVKVTSAHTYGSLIRAYSLVKDLEGVRAVWREMRTRRVPLTSVTLGCMVEALVTNVEPEAGLDLIHEVRDSDEGRAALNSVVYGSVLKGFAHRKSFGQAWEVYQEMLLEKVSLSIVTYNTLMDACARCGEMGRVASLLRDMGGQSVAPNLITYSTILKGYCQDGRLEQAFEVLDTMRAAKLQPDEIVFNSLIDGCARQNLPDRGLEILGQMEEAGVAPSNFTVSILVKLLSRGGDIDGAFRLAEELPKRHRFKKNVHVYSNLVHACTGNRDLPRALGVLERMLGERVRPDARTYRILIQALVAAGEAQEAAGLLRLAAGLPGAPKRFVGPRLADARQQEPLSAELASEVLLAVGRHASGEKGAVALLQDLKKCMPSLRVDPKVQLKITARAARK